MPDLSWLAILLICATHIQLHSLTSPSCVDIECPPCGKYAIAQPPLSNSCCGKCVCIDQCPRLETLLCMEGFKAVKQPRQNERDCCDPVLCVSDDDKVDLTLHIASSETKNDQLDSTNHNKYYTLEPGDDEEFATSSSSESFAAQQDEEDEDYYDYDEDENSMLPTKSPANRTATLCRNQNCASEKYISFQGGTCPKDSHAVFANAREINCCKAAIVCVCPRTCQSKEDVIRGCKMAHNTEFQVVLIQKSQGVPGKCCDVNICHSSNSTCTQNGVFYEHNSSWKLNSCTHCRCHMGQITCEPTVCPILDCEVKQSLTTECCAVCTGQCRNNATAVYAANEMWRESDDCIECTCINGKRSCNAEMCEALPCAKPVKKPGVCCKYCEETKELALSNRRFLKYPPHCMEIVKNFKCKLKCKYGNFALDGNRCPICQCAQEPLKKCAFACDADLAFMPLNDRLCECVKACTLDCNLTCAHGYVLGEDGCEKCQCKESILALSSTCLDLETGQRTNDGDVWFDGCRQCLCQQGHQFCSLISCQKPICNDGAKPIRRKNACCPTCPNDLVQHSRANTTVCFSPPNGAIYYERDFWQLDKCTNCTCHGGVVLCASNCRDCSKSRSDDGCCPFCDLPAISLISTGNSTNSGKWWSCFDSMEQQRAHGDMWHEDDCVTCMCANGERKCFDSKPQCADLANCTRHVSKKGECCPHCLDAALTPFLLEDKFVDNNVLNDQRSSRSKALNQRIIQLALVLATAFIIFLLLIIALLFYKNSRTVSPRTRLPASSPVLTSSSSLVKGQPQHYFNPHFNSKSTALSKPTTYESGLSGIARGHSHSTNSPLLSPTPTQGSESSGETLNEHFSSEEMCKNNTPLLEHYPPSTLAATKAKPPNNINICYL